MPEELFDVLECTGRKTGRTVRRDEAHRSGIWHGAFHCLILYPGDGAWRVMFQKRSRAKQIAPALFDVSVGGHYAAGEGPETAGPREISEELGLSVSYGDLVPVGRRVFVYCFTPALTEYEFQDVFLLPLPGRPASLRLQTDEVEAVLDMPIPHGLELFSGRSPSVAAVMASRDGAPHSVDVTAGAFVPCVDNYFLRLLVLAHRYASGERSLLAI